MLMETSERTLNSSNDIGSAVWCHAEEALDRESEVKSYPNHSQSSSDIVLGFPGKSQWGRHFNGVEIGIGDERP